jgi:hypothetical protein
MPEAKSETKPAPRESPWGFSLGFLFFVTTVLAFTVGGFDYLPGTLRIGPDGKMRGTGNWEFVDKGQVSKVLYINGRIWSRTYYKSDRTIHHVDQSERGLTPWARRGGVAG